jgi:long-chain acyl-CoA synthetase
MLVVVRKDRQLGAADLIAHCKANLAAYKVPKIVVFRDAPLPKSKVGKILRRAVIEQEESIATASRGCAAVIANRSAFSSSAVR